MPLELYAMPNLIAGFDWDDGNRLKCQEHGVAIAGIESVFHGTIWIFRGAMPRAFVRISARFMHAKDQAL